ncbi:CAunnamed protein product [Biomphalaria glabrata]|nr:CAunnamed protein product [Biomphalaria glabrata]
MDQPRYPPEIVHLPMYHANLRSRDEAKEYMRLHHKGEGSYLIRPNTTNDPSFVSITVSITSEGDCCHAKVYILKQNDSNLYYISERQKFSMFHQLLKYYSEHRIHCTQNIDNIRLKTALDAVLVTQRSRNTLSERSNSLTNGSTGRTKNAIQQDEFDTHPRPGSNISGHSRHINHTLPKHPKIPRQTSETGSSRGHSINSQDIHRSNSESAIPVTKYANAGAVQHNVKMLIRCLPPAPLPKLEVPNDDSDFYYTHVDVNKNFFQETYQFLKQNELCECGLRLVDSEFPQGWTVHRSQEAQTKHRIFFQHGDDTTWEMPVEIVPLLSIEQINFIMYLCKEGRCPIPNCLKPRIDHDIVKRKYGVQTLPNNFESTIPKLKIDTNNLDSRKPNRLQEDAFESTLVKQPVTTGRPVSFDSLPTMEINPKVGPPTSGMQDNAAALQRKKEEVQMKQLQQEMKGLKFT